MTRKGILLWSVTLATLAALLIGYVTLQSNAGQVASGHPNDRANHHPKHVVDASQ